MTRPALDSSSPSCQCGPRQPCRTAPGRAERGGGELGAAEPLVARRWRRWAVAHPYARHLHCNPHESSGHTRSQNRDSLGCGMGRPGPAGDTAVSREL